MSAPQQIDAVAHYMPWAADAEREKRLRIRKAQTIASARAMREQNRRARALYFDAASLATDWVFRRVDDLGDLDRILRALTQLFIAADNIFQVEGPDAE